MTYMIAIGVIIVIVLILILLNLHTINFKLSSKDTESNIPIQETKEFQAGMNHGFSLIQICLYKLWEDKTLLDFESINDELKNTLLYITQSPDHFRKWNQKYIEYLKDKEKGINSNE